MPHITADQKMEIVKDFLEHVAKRLPREFDDKYTLHEAVEMLREGIESWNFLMEHWVDDG